MEHFFLSFALSAICVPKHQNVIIQIIKALAISLEMALNCGWKSLKISFDKVFKDGHVNVCARVGVCAWTLSTFLRYFGVPHSLYRTFNLIESFVARLHTCGFNY